MAGYAASFFSCYNLSIDDICCRCLNVPTSSNGEFMYTINCMGSDFQNFQIVPYGGNTEWYVDVVTQMPHCCKSTCDA
jgi:hypothetical protein